MEQPGPQPYQNGESDPLYGDNHLTLIRWMLAGMVVISHSWLMSRSQSVFSLFENSLGDLAVNGFFIISGMLIAKSLHTTASLRSYAISRTLRIMPALMVVTLSFPLFFSPLFSTPGGLEKIIAPENWQYVLRVWTLGDPENAPGGIFAAHRYPDFNTPLWTIRIEILAYIAAALLFFTGLARDLPRILMLTIGISAAYALILYAPHLAVLSVSKELLRLASCFLLGMLFFHAPILRRLGWRGIAVSGALCILASPTVFAPLTMNLTLAFILVYVGLPNRADHRTVTIPDYSYGIYIWHAPVMQAFIFFFTDIAPLTLLVLSAPITVLLAGLSWIFVEKPALSLKRQAMRVGTAKASSKLT